MQAAVVLYPIRGGAGSDEDRPGLVSISIEVRNLESNTR